MIIYGKEKVGDVVKKQRAFKGYASHKPQRRDPGLHEHVDIKRIEMKAFPSATAAEQEVQSLLSNNPGEAFKPT